MSRNTFAKVVFVEADHHARALDLIPITRRRLYLLLALFTRSIVAALTRPRTLPKHARPLKPIEKSLRLIQLMKRPTRRSPFFTKKSKRRRSFEIGSSPGQTMAGWSQTNALKLT